MTRRARTVLLVLPALLLAGCGSSSASPATSQGLPGTVRVGIIPNIAPDTQRALYAPLGDYLGRTLHRKVELFVATNYAGVVTALAAGKIDVAYLGGLTYVQADKQVPVTPVVTEVDRETGTPKYLSAVVVRTGARYRTVGDLLAGHASFAFGDPSSTSGSLYPRLMLDAAGARCPTDRLDSCPPLSSVRFTGGHDATALAVAAGRVDAGGLELRILHKLEKKGTVRPGALRVLDSRLVEGYPWVVRTALGTSAADAVRQAFLSIKDSALLTLLRARRYVAVQPGDYADVRTEAQRVGLLR